MKLDIYDLEAIADKRVNMAEGKGRIYKVYGALIAIGIGFYLYQQVNVYAGMALSGVAALFMWWYSKSLSGRQKRLKAQLIDAYNAEQEAVK